MRILEANIEEEQKKNQQEHEALKFVTETRETVLTEHVHNLIQLANDFKQHEKEQKKHLQAKQEDKTLHTQLVGKPQMPDLYKVVK